MSEIEAIDQDPPTTAPDPLECEACYMEWKGWGGRGCCETCDRHHYEHTCPNGGYYAVGVDTTSAGTTVAVGTTTPDGIQFFDIGKIEPGALKLEQDPELEALFADGVRSFSAAVRDMSVQFRLTGEAMHRALCAIGWHPLPRLEKHRGRRRNSLRRKRRARARAHRRG